MAEKRVDYQVLKEGKEEILRVDANKWSYLPSIEDNALVMAGVIDLLAEMPSIGRIVFNQKRNYSYDSEQTTMLVEIAGIYNHLVRDKKILALGYTEKAAPLISNKVASLQYLIFNLLRSDPLGAYVETKRLFREERINLSRENDDDLIEVRNNYIKVLEYVLELLKKTKMISRVSNDLDGYALGDRSLYRSVFKVVITPDFMFTRLMASPPLDGEQLDVYKVEENEINVFKVPGNIKYLYHVIPPEFKLTEDKYNLLDLARGVLSEHKPRQEEFLDPSRMRRTFFNIGRDLLQELAASKGIDLDFNEFEELARILVRYTVGFGLIEVLLRDPKIQDVVVNAPIGRTPIYIVHQEYGECVTNIIPAREDGESWASKFRILSGRPLDEANPVLDTELFVPGARARVAIITEPLSPVGLAYAFRRHRDLPWTLPLFIENGMIDSLGAGLISFLVDGARTMIIGGTRSSGKTSFLGSVLIEIMRKYRIITCEDTRELPVDALRDLGYNIQPMKVRSALTTGGSEMGADEGIRTSLRLGDSSLIVGEIRSTEAKALYEAMRIGALANVVAGTIHGADPYSIFDRVVNDLGVPRTSFKATDVIIVANPIKSADGMNSWKRILQIAEVRKHWEDDPLRERGFVDLMKYNTSTDKLEPSADLMNGDSEVLKSIAGNIKEWAGNWDAIWENILLRAKIKQTLVDYSKISKDKSLLESDFVVKSNDIFHMISGSVREEVGSLDNKRIYFEWEDWLKRAIKERGL